MILYMDIFITDSALFPNKELVKIEDKVRKKSKAYRYQNKLDITKYSLASYAPYKWSKVIIKYDLDSIYNSDEFENYCYSLFEDPIIINGRSDNQTKFQESYKLFENSDDDFVFWVPNNDHPLVMASYDELNKVIDSANSLCKQLQTKNISIDYSHYFESDYLYRKNSPVSFLKSDSDVVFETQSYYLVNFPHGYFAGCQIYHKNLFHKLFFSKSYDNERIIRPECLSNKIEIEQYVVFPKFEICRHYDGYMHTKIHQKPYILEAKDVPPLFIPDGFFENQACIRYGFLDYDAAAININPLIDNYSFENKFKKTDLKISIDEIPVFWQGLTITKNKSESKEGLKLASKKEWYRILNLWGDSIENRFGYIFNVNKNKFIFLFIKNLKFIRSMLLSKN